MKNKGFTLIELLAMLVVLGILMAITIPNVTGIIGNQKVNQFRVDATNMVERVKTKVAKDSKVVKPGVGECVIFTLDYLNDDDEYTKGPNNGTYEQFDSFVVYTQENTSTGAKKYKYYVRLVEKVGSQYYGFDLKDIDEIPNLKDSKINSLYGLSNNETTSTTTISNNKPSMCTSIKKYYIHRNL